MNIGLTYDLKDDYLQLGYGKEETAELDSIRTIDALDSTLTELGYQVKRVGHLKALAARLLAGERWDLVFNIAEGFRGLGREAQVPALLDAFEVPYTFSDPLVLTLTLHKGMTKHVVRDLGVPTPDFAVVEDELDIAHVRLPFPLFAKPVAEGTSKGISADSKIHSSEELAQVCRDLLARYRQPVLVEEYLSGREFTVGIAGTGRKARVLGVSEVLLLEKAEAGVYSYSNKAYYEDRVRYHLVDGPIAEEAGDVALAAWKGLGCRDAGRVDVRCAANGSVQFIEVNPLAGLNPVWSDLPILCGLAGISYRELLQMIVESASERIEKESI
ncbi:MAG: D-alanine--D-alanine ligase [Acidobacteriota bacterium]